MGFVGGGEVTDPIDKSGGGVGREVFVRDSVFVGNWKADFGDAVGALLMSCIGGLVYAVGLLGTGVDIGTREGGPPFGGTYTIYFEPFIIITGFCMIVGLLESVGEV